MIPFAGGSLESLLACVTLVPLGYLIALVALAVACQRTGSRGLVFGLAAVPIVGDIATLSWLRHELSGADAPVIGGSALLALVAVVVSVVISRRGYPAERAVVRSMDRQATEWWARQVKAQAVRRDDWRRAA